MEIKNVIVDHRSVIIRLGVADDDENIFETNVYAKESEDRHVKKKKKENGTVDV